MSDPLFSCGTWDMDAHAYTPQIGVPAFNLTTGELRRSLRMLKDCGYSVHRLREANGEHEVNDSMVLVERTDGMGEVEILERWKR